MTTITLPASPRANSDSWKLEMPAQRNFSGWTGKRSVLASGRGWWTCSYSLPAMTKAQFKPWRSFLAQMRGGANEAQVPVDGGASQYTAYNPNGLDPEPQLVLNFMTGQIWTHGNPADIVTPTVNGASQTGRSLITDGWPSSVKVLEDGDFVTVNDQLLQITSDIYSDASGNATLAFEPPLRTSPADNASIEYETPYALMMLEEIPGWTHDVGPVYGLSITFREAF